ncbi:hypothetical protein CHS0354_033434 [Potamilus streckersoni]|uniref:Copper transport protein n=1 Tax=Potamilus streckersoni TaxID=2493646 RepID=A0AAE0VVF3_9BIVA|nr:hypothetical protein CHS0354_033434 [Potamilus streckersoni]
MGDFSSATELDDFLFKGLNISSTAQLVGCCIVSCIATCIYEATKSLMLYVQVQIHQNPLINGKKVNSVQERSPLFSSLAVPSSVDQIKRRRLRYHVFGYFVHVFNITLGYFIMLAVMQFSAWVTIAILIGSCIGYFIFGAVNSWNKWKFSHLMPASSNNSPSTSQHHLFSQ